MKTKAILFTAPGKVSITEFELPALRRGEVLVRTLYTGVSTGTEMRVLAGRQAGQTFPCVPGYENVGEVVEVGCGGRWQAGRKVFVGQSDFTGPFARLWGGHVEYAILDSRRLLAIPEDADLTAALYAKTCAIAFHGMKRARVGAADLIAIVGQGLIGHLATQVAKTRGARVIAIDTVTARCEAALQAGADLAINASTEDVHAAIARYSDSRLTVVVDATGVASAIASSIRLLSDHPWQPPFPRNGRFVLLGTYTAPIILEHEPVFMIEPDIIVSRDCTRSDVAASLGLLVGGRVSPRCIPTSIYPVADAPSAYEALRNGGAMRVIFKW